MIFPLNWVKSSILSYFMPNNISYFWNLGSFAGIVLAVQIMTGLLLSFSYSTTNAFFLVNMFCKDSFWGFILRIIHLNFASLFFVCVYIHMFRGIYYKSFNKIMVWMSGTTILLVLMITAFLGYVLPWGQMSLWGATVITNLFSALNNYLVIWLWGDFSVSMTTLSFFYSLHFLMPFVLLAIVLFHIIYLHETGSKSKLYLNGGMKMEFNNYLLHKDSLNLFVIFLFLEFVLMFPFALGDAENFILANSLSSPLHIKPEWYFLFAYAILRSIPNKIGGVLAFALSVVLFYFLPFKKCKINSTSSKVIFFSLLSVLFILTWLGGNPVEAPFIVLGQIFTGLYFLMFIIL